MARTAWWHDEGDVMGYRRLDDTGQGRLYEIDTENGSVSYPSVTNILSAVAKPALLHWMANQEREHVITVAADIHEAMSDAKPMTRMGYLNTLKARLSKEKAGTRAARKAADIGTQVHALVEWTLKQELGLERPDEPRLTTDAARNAFASWVEWRQSVHLKPVHIEQTVWSHEHQYAGTLDLIAEIDGQLAVTDWKTGKAIYPESHLQGVAYARAVCEMGHATPPVDAYVVLLPKTQAGRFQVAHIPAEQHEALFQTFLSVKRVWEYTHADAAPKQDTLIDELRASIHEARRSNVIRDLLHTHAGLATEDIKALADARVMELEAFEAAEQAAGGK